METQWFLGIDLGTGSCKSVVVDASARMLGLGAASYPGSNAGDRWQEQDPDGLLDGLFAAVRAAIAQAGVHPEDCAGISIGGALHNILALDTAGRPLTGVMTWADDRAASQAIAARKTSFADELYVQSGCPIHWMYPLYKVYWLRQEQPEIFRAARRFVSAKEFVLKRLCGEWIVDHAVASGSGLFNIHTHEWNPASLELAGIGPEKLSPLGSPHQPLGGLAPCIARQMGLPADVPFFLGSSDAANSSLGAGAGLEGEATCMIGTSGALRVISSRPVLGAAGRNWCYCLDEDHWLVGGAVNNGGIALSWLQNMLNSAFEGLGPEKHLSFEDILSMAAAIEPGAGGLICLPLIAGERSPNWDLNARGAFFGLTLTHTSHHLARALLEGIGFRFRSLKEMLGEIGLDIRWLRASGGFTHSAFWLQLMADLLGCELSVPLVGESSAVGAAFWAMGADGPCGAIAQVGRWIPIGKTFTPDPARAAVYDRLYPLFRDLYGALAPLFEPAAQFQAGRSPG